MLKNVIRRVDDRIQPQRLNVSPGECPPKGGRPPRTKEHQNEPPSVCSGLNGPAGRQQVNAGSSFTDTR